MPLTTKKLISDSVLYKLNGGTPDTSYPVDERDIWKALEGKINATYGMRQFTMNLPQGGTIPDNLVLGTYEDVALTSVSEICKATLPVMPISLPRNAGVNEIRPILSKRGADRQYGRPCIPLQAGQNYLLQSNPALNDLMGQFGYEVNGSTIWFTKDLTTFGIDTVTMKLVVFDISQYGVSDYLPVPADIEQQLINELTAEFAQITPETGIVNNFSSANQKTNP